MCWIFHIFGLFLLFNTESRAQRTRNRNLLAFSSHEPERTQQTIFVEPRVGTETSGRVDSHLPIALPLDGSFLPKGFLSANETSKEIIPTPISPVVTTLGTDSITKSINNLLSSVNNHVDTKSPHNAISQQTSALRGLIKATAEKHINEILSNTLGGLGGLVGKNNIGETVVDDILARISPTTSDVHQRNDNSNTNSNNLRLSRPLVLLNRPNTPVQSNFREDLSRNIQMPIQSQRSQSSASTPLVLSNNLTPPSRPLVLAPTRRNEVQQRNAESITLTLPEVRTTLTNRRFPTVINQSVGSSSPTNLVGRIPARQQVTIRSRVQPSIRGASASTTQLHFDRNVTQRQRGVRVVQTHSSARIVPMPSNQLAQRASQTTSDIRIQTPSSSRIVPMSSNQLAQRAPQTTSDVRIQTPSRTRIVQMSSNQLAQRASQTTSDVRIQTPLSSRIVPISSNQLAQRTSQTTSDERIQCPSQDECKLVVPASCRRQTFVTDDNGRRVCRGCDEDRCAFGGFERRWGHGFG